MPVFVWVWLLFWKGSLCFLEVCRVNPLFHNDSYRFPLRQILITLHYVRGISWPQLGGGAEMVWPEHRSAANTRNFLISWILGPVLLREGGSQCTTFPVRPDTYSRAGEGASKALVHFSSGDSYTVYCDWCVSEDNSQELVLFSCVSQDAI